MPLHKPVVMVFGRFNPPTTGHEALITFVKSVAHRVNGDVRVYPSQSQDPRKNPLPFRNKVLFLRKFFPGVVVSDNTAIRSPFDALAEVSQLGYTDVILVVGSDRVQDFEKFGAYLLPRNSPKYDPNKHIAINNYKVVSVPVSRDPDAEGVSGMSASKMRKFAADNDYTSFRQGVPAHVSERDAKSLFQQVRQYMGLHETFKITTGQFAVGLFEAHITANDQLRGARIIYRALTNTDAPHGMVNPIDIINSSIPLMLKAKHVWRNATGWHTAGEMLTKARKELGIKWDMNLIKPELRQAMRLKEADGGYTPAKPETETDRLRTSQQQELIALKTRQANQMMAAKLRDVQNKAREAQMKATQPKPAAKPAS